MSEVWGIQIPIRKDRMIGKSGDRMTEWKCSKCGYSFSADTPPDECPSCKRKCEFVNVTCYIPECKDEGRDYRI